MATRPKYVIPELYQDPTAEQRKREAAMLSAATAPKTPTPTVSQAPAPVAPTPMTAQPLTMAPTPTGGTTRTITPWEYSPETMGVYGKLKESTYAAPVTGQDIMNSPEYKDIAAAINYQSDQAYAGLTQDLASRNALRSAQGNIRGGELRGAFNAQLLGQLPALINTVYQRRQQDLANQRALLGDSRGLQDAAFSRGVTDFNIGRGVYESDRNFDRGVLESDRSFNRNVVEGDRSFGLAEAGVTGRYTDSQVASLLQAVIAAKQSWANENDGTTRAQDEAAANAARQALAGMGFTPEQIESRIGAGVTLEAAQANLGQFTQPTLAGQRATREASAADTKAQLDALELKARQLEADLALDPEVGQRAMLVKELEKTNAEIASIKALETQRLSKTGTTADPDKAREQAIKDLSAYDITPIASGVWVDLKTELDNIQSQAGGLDRTQAAQLLQAMLSVPGLTGKDRGFIAAMFAGYFGDNLGNTLDTYRKGYKPPEEDPLAGLGM